AKCSACGAKNDRLHVQPCTKRKAGFPAPRSSYASFTPLRSMIGMAVSLVAQVVLHHEQNAADAACQGARRPAAVLDIVNELLDYGTQCGTRLRPRTRTASASAPSAASTASTRSRSASCTKAIWRLPSR